MFYYFILHKPHLLKSVLIYVSVNIGPGSKLFFSVMNISENCVAVHKEFFSSTCPGFYQCWEIKYRTIMWIRYTCGTNKEPVFACMQIMFGETHIETSHL